MIGVVLQVCIYMLTDTTLASPPSGPAILPQTSLLKEKELLKRDRKLFPAKGKVAQGI
jgi:hypothetical protein